MKVITPEEKSRVIFLDVNVRTGTIGIPQPFYLFFWLIQSKHTYIGTQHLYLPAVHLYAFSQGFIKDVC